MTKASPKKVSEDNLPDAHAVAECLSAISSFAAAGANARVVEFFHRLQHNPPQVILIEGGTVAGRLAAADYWLLLLNCPNGGPCFSCPACIRFATHLHRDCFFLDGTEGSIKIGTLRDDVRPVLGEPPREALYRGVIFHEAQYMTPDAANIMLKSLEEPVSATTFLLLAPQRERLLPTLVSRSMTLTLPWTTASSSEEPQWDEWEQALCQFLLTGKGLMAKTGQRGSIDIYSGQAIINLCRKKLAQCLAGRPPSGNQSLADFFARMPAARQRMADEVLSEAQDMMLAGVSSATVIEWAATRLYLLTPRKH